MITFFKKFKATFFIAFFAMLPLISCSSGNDYADPSIYGSPPQNPYGNAPGGMGQQQNPYYGGSPYGNPPQQQQQYGGGYYQQPQQPVQPNSRYYSNPYAMPPQNRYPYYDGDQYYVPPTYYGKPEAVTSPYPDNISRF